jgi:hypothetical protein
MHKGPWEVSAHVFSVMLKTVSVVTDDCPVALVSDCTQVAYDTHNYL